MRIELNPQQLSHYGLALDTVRAAVANSSTALPKGYVITSYSIHYTKLYEVTSAIC